MTKKRQFRIPKTRKVVRSKHITMKQRKGMEHHKLLKREKKLQEKLERAFMPLATGISKVSISSFRIKKRKVKPKVEAPAPFTGPAYTALHPHQVTKSGFTRRLSDAYPYRILKGKRIGGRPWYGPYPNPIGITKIFDISVTPKCIKFIYGEAISNAHISLMKAAIVDTMRDLYTKILNYGESLINRYVPEDTGELRKSLILSLSDDREKGSYVPRAGEEKFTNMKLQIRIFSELKYAGIVNNMPNPVLKHPSSAHKAGMRGKKGNVLFDPHAIKGFFSMVKMKIKTMIKTKYTREFLKDIESIFGISYNQARGMFKILMR